MLLKSEEYQGRSFEKTWVEESLDTTLFPYLELKLQAEYLSVELAIVRIYLSYKDRNFDTTDKPILLEFTASRCNWINTASKELDVVGTFVGSSTRAFMEAMVKSCEYGFKVNTGDVVIEFKVTTDTLNATVIRSEDKSLLAASKRYREYKVKQTYLTRDAVEEPKYRVIEPKFRVIEKKWDERGVFQFDLETEVRIQLKFLPDELVQVVTSVVDGKSPNGMQLDEGTFKEDNWAVEVLKQNDLVRSILGNNFLTFIESMIVVAKTKSFIIDTGVINVCFKDLKGVPTIRSTNITFHEKPLVI